MKWESALPRLTKTTVEGAAARQKQYSIWCSELPGFGAYILPSGKRTYFVDYRNAAGVRRRLTIGRHGKITAEVARKQAIEMMGQAMRGGDPADVRSSARSAMNVRELCEAYLVAMDGGLISGKNGRSKKRSTIKIDRGRITRHIIPLLGSKSVRDLQQSDIHRFIRDVASGKSATVEKTTNLRGKAVVTGGLGTAARTTGLLGSLLTFAVSDGLISINPARGVKRPADKRRQRRLLPEEYAQLGEGIDALLGEGSWQPAVAIKLLALTGCRSSEIIQLRWDEVDMEGHCLRLRESKEGASIRPIGQAAVDLLATVQTKPDCEYVLPPVRNGEYYGGLPRAWKGVVSRAGLQGVTPHTLRHSFASVAADIGFADSTIATMLGHQTGSVTSRYIHHLDSVLLSAADRVAAQIQDMLATRPQLLEK